MYAVAVPKQRGQQERERVCADQPWMYVCVCVCVCWCVCVCRCVYHFPT